MAEHVMHAGVTPSGVWTGQSRLPADGRQAVPSEPPEPPEPAGHPTPQPVVPDEIDGVELSDVDPATRTALLSAGERMARMGTWSLDLSTARAYFSDGLRELCDLPASCTLADAVHLVNEDDRPIIAQFRAMLAAPGQAPDAAGAGEPIEAEVRDVSGDRAFYLRAVPEFDPSGAMVRVTGTVQEVTHLRAFDRRTSQDLRLFGDAQRVAGLGTWEWNTETGECNWSSMLYELFGVEPGTPMTYQAYLGMVHADDRDWVNDRWQQLARSGRPVECEHRVIRTDGARRVLRCHGAVLNHGRGRTVMIGTAQDVTEQRSTETRMMRSSQRFSDLVSIAPVGIGLFDEAQRLVDANDALCRLLETDLERLRGTAADQLAHPNDRSEPLLGDPAAAHPGRDGWRDEPDLRSGQRKLATATGKTVYCELSVAMSVADDGHRFWLVVFSDVTDRRRAAERLRYQATHDELTGLPGRAAVKELLGTLLGGPDADSVALLFCDVDNFKRVNDSLGHDVGDELLVALARRLERGLPPSCTAARMSGDEFVVICSDVLEVGGVEALAGRVARLLRTAIPVRGELLRVSATIGAAVPNRRDTSAADLLRFADAAMFDAKSRGAGRVSLANAALIATADNQVQLEGQLRDAIGNDELVLHYQPVVAHDGTVLSAEALVRWPHPERGLLSPGEFLPVAERGDLLRELDQWVLRTALREAAGWPILAGGVLGGGIGVAVNLSGLVPSDPDFVDLIAMAVAETGVDWDRVVLELVETSLIDLPSRTIKAMDELADRGVRFAVDDFGTGYSSLSRLKELPAQIIKIDRAFVSGVDRDASDFAVARALVDMARAMGRTCVAEGVETSSQFHVLRSVGVEAYQGWLLSKPLPAREFRELLGLGPIHIPRGC